MISRVIAKHLYTYACHEDERTLCRMELSALFGTELREGWLESPLDINVSRSPFVKVRINILYEGHSPQEIAERVGELELNGATFKIIFVETDGRLEYSGRRAVEREVGARVRGRADVRNPEVVFALANPGGRWLFGIYAKNEAVWLKHNDKPQHYSTALSTRVARAVANIAVPHPEGRKAIDPCCGIGTVLVEALSMGIDIVGFDINPLAVRGARVNLAHFGMPNIVGLSGIGDVSGSYDAAIVDLPYNLCSRISEEEQLALLGHARRLAGTAVLITTETVDHLIGQAGFTIADRCFIKKGSFVRQVMVCR
ncbi:MULTISPECIES: RNA methyltransferase [unclassified Paenibacillus]|uniref:TRM11 family SAM-dependent methyltransferase n=1 Tax=unclassified Paenibacillus TaxID=185978 RepID=UPI001AE2EA5A|nr:MULTISPECIES: RNA methyltransferase [unclassified Paenibacillus]MBP1157602.1 tRNA G10 N-methylase Trm11 [Paenibacillus sp. PvP091]MBP1171661.1 tRNA G10 N-methylase Trm11 [Paenibacillus sp. PvR098]MBP2438042.1 tRNA G10 N-methylase Trm11 [Paenibacillus sp. PvP052]